MSVSLMRAIEEPFELETEMINTVESSKQRSTQPFDDSELQYRVSYGTYL